jgi:hypothetical protein
LWRLPTAPGTRPDAAGIPGERTRVELAFSGSPVVTV